MEFGGTAVYIVVARTGAVGAGVCAAVDHRPRVGFARTPFKLAHVTGFPSFGGGHFAHQKPNSVHSCQSGVGGAVDVVEEGYHRAVGHVVADVHREGGGAL